MAPNTLSQPPLPTPLLQRFRRWPPTRPPQLSSAVASYQTVHAAAAFGYTAPAVALYAVAPALSKDATAYHAAPAVASYQTVHAAPAVASSQTFHAALAYVSVVQAPALSTFAHAPSFGYETGLFGNDHGLSGYALDYGYSLGGYGNYAPSFTKGSVNSEAISYF